MLVVAVGYLGFNRQPAVDPAQQIQPPAGAPLDERPDLDRLIGVFEEKTTTSEDPLDHRYLGRLYLTKAGLTGDMADYRRARVALGKAQELFPDDKEAIGLEARAAFSLHEFADAGILVDRWSALEPDNLDALALSGDIALAVGDLTTAEERYRMLFAELPAHPALQVRLAQLAVAAGEVDDAVARATVAESTAREVGFTGRSLAWYQSFLGQLLFDTGDYSGSAAMFTTALENAPSSTHDMAGIGRARAAEGDLDSALEFLTLATDTEAPAVDDLGYLADVYEVAGRQEEAAAARERIEAQLKSGTLDTAVHGRLAALYFLDHDVHFDLALELAESDLDRRRDAGAWDTYAWALYKHGRTAEAHEAAQRALATGVQEAAFYYHAGLIELGMGNSSDAMMRLEQALAISPRFHPIHAQIASQLVEQLG